jgi:hypothetical protein
MRSAPATRLSDGTLGLFGLVTGFEFAVYRLAKFTVCHYDGSFSDARLVSAR